MRQVWIPRPGPPEVLELRESADPDPRPGDVRVRVETAGVSWGDVAGRLGLYRQMPSPPLVPGFEVAGRIDAVGDGVASKWIGRDVLGLTRYGGYADVVCTPAFRVAPRPAGMSPQEGAALPVNYLTAYLIVERMGGLKADETVLVHGAGGGVGTACVQLARRIGARVIGTASAAKHDFLKSAGVDVCIDYTREDFEERVREVTDGRGVELVLDPRGGISLRKSCRCLAPTGRLGMFGMSDVAKRKARGWRGALRAAWAPRLRFTPPALMRGSFGVFGINLGNLWEESERVARWMQTLLGYYAEGSIRPIIARSFPLAEAAAAHHYIEERHNIGKVLLVP